MDDLLAMLQLIEKRFHRHADNLTDSQAIDDAGIVAMDLQSTIRGMQSLSLQQYRRAQQKAAVPVPILRSVK